MKPYAQAAVCADIFVHFMQLEVARMTSILIAGIGGQGSIFAARALGETALRCGLRVRGSETIGMAQRGGSVTSHVRMSQSEIASPLIPPGGAGALLALNPIEGERNRHYLCAGGQLVCLLEAQKAEIIRQCGTKSLNAALLGAAAKLGAFPFDLAALKETMRSFGRPEFAEQNAKALCLGAEMMQGGRPKSSENQ
jgi:indolepyruvate ferredoxin oxidoreductase beta subunit